MVRSALLFVAAALVAAPASAVTLMDSVPDRPETQPRPAVASEPGMPHGHVVIEDFENTLRDGLVFASVKKSVMTLPPAPAGAALTAEAPAAAEGVPEPASWALMIAGFAFTGAALRRRSFRTTASLSR